MQIIKVKQIKIASLALLMLFLIGIAVTAMQGGIGYAATAGQTVVVGYINTEQVLMQHPGMEKARSAYQADIEQAKTDFETQTVNLGEKEKEEYYNQIQQRLNIRQQELMAPLVADVNAAIKAVAAAQGLAAVFEANAVVYGGMDIANEVLKVLNQK